MLTHRRMQEEMILDFLKNHKSGITRLETAHLLGLPKTAHIAKILREMVEKELLFVMRGVDNRRRNVFIYFRIEELNK